MTVPGAQLHDVGSDGLGTWLVGLRHRHKVGSRGSITALSKLQVIGVTQFNRPPSKGIPATSPVAHVHCEGFEGSIIWVVMSRQSQIVGSIGSRTALRLLHAIGATQFRRPPTRGTPAVRPLAQVHCDGFDGSTICVVISKQSQIVGSIGSSTALSALQAIGATQFRRPPTRGTPAVRPLAQVHCDGFDGSTICVVISKQSQIVGSIGSSTALSALQAIGATQFRRPPTRGIPAVSPVAQIH